MIRMLRAILDGLLLRCPRCERGPMFARRFTMYQSCPVCGLAFEQASGEITGGMAINIVLTLLVIVVSALALGRDPAIPLLPLLGGLGLFAIMFPIVFYRSSRGLWVSFLYLTGSNNESD